MRGRNGHEVLVRDRITGLLSAQDINMRFLIVDDSSTMRRIIINTFNKLGHQDVAEAGNGREGLDRLSAGGPVDVIVTRRWARGSSVSGNCPKRSRVPCVFTTIRRRARRTVTNPR
jgi:DNA-binding NtrC family response regulator